MTIVFGRNNQTNAHTKCAHTIEATATITDSEMKKKKIDIGYAFGRVLLAPFTFS